MKGTPYRRPLPGGPFGALTRGAQRNGYRIVPLDPESREPVYPPESHPRIGPGDIGSLRRCALGIVCGVGANPVVALHIRSETRRLVQIAIDLLQGALGETVHTNPNDYGSVLLYRAAGRRAAISRTSTGFDSVRRAGEQHLLRVIGTGGIALAATSDRELPLQWTRKGRPLAAGLADLRAYTKGLQEITEQHIQDALSTFEAVAEVVEGLDPVHPRTVDFERGTKAQVLPTVENICLALSSLGDAQPVSGSAYIKQALADSFGFGNIPKLTLNVARDQIKEAGSSRPIPRLLAREGVI